MGCPVCCCRAPSQFGMQRGVDTPGNSVINADGHLNRVDTPGNSVINAAGHLNRVVRPQRRLQGGGCVPPVILGLMAEGRLVCRRPEVPRPLHEGRSDAGEPRAHCGDCDEHAAKHGSRRVGVRRPLHADRQLRPSILGELRCVG